MSPLDYGYIQTGKSFYAPRVVVASGDRDDPLELGIKGAVFLSQYIQNVRMPLPERRACAILVFDG